MKSDEKGFYREISSILKSKNTSKDELGKLKLVLSKKYHLSQAPTDIQILLNTNVKIKTKPTRTGAGVAVVALMTKPIPCPHGKCTMCPGGPESFLGNVPQSYTGKEPATLRGLRNHFDAYLQVFNRLEQYIVMGHAPEKAELIIMGGTFPSFPKEYQEEFITYAFKAMNDFSDLFYKKNVFDIEKFKKFFELPGPVGDPAREKHIHEKLLKMKGTSNLEHEQRKNENSAIRCVGLTIETRPDYGKLEHGNELLRLGATRVEVGVQSVYDDVLKKIHRGHTVEDTRESFRVLKDLGFKINAHYMPGLPGANRKKDLDGMKALFYDPYFRPDMLKIYPCMVIKGTKLYTLWKKGKYKPLTTKQAAKMIAKFKATIPEYVRIMRVQRDIPTYMISAGVDRTNLRQYVMEYMKKHNMKCRCMRCREAWNIEMKNPNLHVHEYEASKGKEFFISVEEKDKVFGFCRLRFPSRHLRKEITKDSALIRELHVYGEAAPIGQKGVVQHQGLGSKLLEKAEQIAKHNKFKKMVIISGIGVRNYYKKHGYEKEGPYMVKKL